MAPKSSPVSGRRHTARPSNRRALIIAAAADLFFQRGFDQISMADLAEPVGVVPSAIYRHFAGKQELLRDVLTEGLSIVREVVGHLDFTDGPKTLVQLGSLAIDQRQLGVLWHREARFLSAEDRATISAELCEIARLLAVGIRIERPGLSVTDADFLAWSVLAVLTSTSFHHLALTQPEHDQLLASMVGIVLHTPLPCPISQSSPITPEPPALTPRSRREALLAQAIRMFAREGYARVSLDDLAAAVGMAGPSVYHHFPSKRDILVTAFRRGTAVLFMDLSTIYREAAAGSQDLIKRLVHSYIRFALDHHDLVGLLITETEHLPADERDSIRQAQRDYLTEWLHILHAVAPETEPTTARIKVHVALSLANNVARTPHLRLNPEVALALEAVCVRILQGPASDQCYAGPGDRHAGLTARSTPHRRSTAATFCSTTAQASEPPS